MCQNTEIEGFSEHYPHGTFVDWHHHEGGQIAHATHGVMRIHAEGGLWIVPPGRALWIPRGVVDGIECHGDVSMRTLYITGVPPSTERPLGVWNITQLMRELILRFCDAGAVHTRDAMTSLLLGEMRASISLPLMLPLPTEPKLNKLCRELANPAQRQHTLEQAAAEVGQSPRSFIRNFQKATGMTFRHWRLQARLMTAIEHLSQGHSVSKTAFEAGYDSLSAFSAAFKSTFGVNPSVYRSR